MKKQVLAGALAASIAAVAIAGGTLAYFTATDEAENTFTIGDVSIALHEPGWTESGKADGADWYPNEALAKDPKVENTSKANPVIVRVKVDGIDGEKIHSEYGDDYAGGNTYNTADWTLMDDGYYYYNYAVEAGETTNQLFDRIRLDKGVKSASEVTVDSVDVYAEAIQAQGLLPGSYKTHFGEDWNQKISDTDLKDIAEIMNAEFSAQA